MNKVEREIQKIEDACGSICEKVTCTDCVLYARLGELRAELWLSDQKKAEERRLAARVRRERELKHNPFSCLRGC